ncbi:MAG: hypothetical protein ACKVS6_01195 [Planctomycetota bacterium]
MGNTAASTLPIPTPEFAGGLGAVGLNHHVADFRQLAKFAVDPSRRARVAARLREAGLAEFIILSTCNRVEVYFYNGDPSRRASAFANSILQILANDTEVSGINNIIDINKTPHFALDGPAAAKHIFEVCASLDSLVVGELQITGQLRQAAAAAEEFGTIGPRLRTITNEAFRIARSVRRETRLCQGSSVVSLATEQLRNAVRRIVTNANVNLPVALVGAGEMTQRAAITLSKRENIHILFVNRTLSKAQALAARFRGSAVSLSEFITNPPAVAACMTATSAPSAIFTHIELCKLQKARETALRANHNDPLLIADLAVPFDVDPNISNSPLLDIVRMDQLRIEAERRAALQQNEVARAREILNSRFDILANRANQRAFSSLHARACSISNAPVRLARSPVV